ncbi:MAG: ribonuclease E/G [Peptoniphilaceae bacterium]|nr:ribonuclease E/G [Peptoniphilaceae bacterium]MDY6018575.1 ribonuclease E/G [Anaerococcus sp.]
MKSYIFVDKENKAYGKIIDDKLLEMFFYNEDLGNIYRAKVVNKIDAINAYFLEYETGKEAFLKSSKKFSIGDSVIGEIVREASNNKLALFSVNFKLETDNYEIYRFPRAKKAILKEGKTKSKKEYKYLNDLRDKLEKEENFKPTPKLLFEKNSKDLYIKNQKDLEVVEISIFQDSIINDAFKNLKNNKIYYGHVSLIFDELETLTVIDVNSSKAKGSQKQNDFFDKVNKNILEPIAYNLKLRNIGGMVIIDFLRTENKESLEEDFKKQLDHYGLVYQIYGFTNMGLFELSLKRKGESLTRLLKEKNIL